MPPYAENDHAKQDQPDPHKLPHGFPYPFETNHPTGESRDVGAKEKEHHKRDAGEEHGVVEVVRPETGVINVVVEERQYQTNEPKNHTDRQVPFDLGVKYELRIQIHITLPAFQPIFLMIEQDFNRGLSGCLWFSAENRRHAFK
jgi:hypothetical protein